MLFLLDYCVYIYIYIYVCVCVCVCEKIDSKVIQVEDLLRIKVDTIEFRF